MKYCEAAIILKGWLKGTNRNAKPIIIINQQCNAEDHFHILNAVEKKIKIRDNAELPADFSALIYKKYKTYNLLSAKLVFAVLDTFISVKRPII